MRKAMSKKVGAGGRFDIFLDSVSISLQLFARNGQNFTIVAILICFSRI